MKVNITTDLDVPADTKYILTYYKKSNNQTAIYPISRLIMHNGKYMRAEVLGRGIRTFVNERILSLNPVGD